MEAGSGRGAYRRGRVVAHRPARSTHGACTRRRGLGLVWTWWPKACTVEHARRGTRRRSPSWRLDDPTDDSSSRIYLTTISMCVASRSSISKLRAPATKQTHRPPRGGRFLLTTRQERAAASGAAESRGPCRDSVSGIERPREIRSLLARRASRVGAGNPPGSCGVPAASSAVRCHRLTERRTWP